MDSRKAAALEIFSVAEDEQLVRVLDEFLADLATGVAVDAERLLAAHPDLAPRLRNCLAGLRCSAQLRRAKHAHRSIAASEPFAR